MFHFVNLLHTSVIRPQQSNGSGSQREEENQKEERLATHPTCRTARAHGQFPRGQKQTHPAGASGSWLEETATSCRQGNSSMTEVKSFQQEQLNSATSCPERLQ